jgi:hypothetical protein
MLIGEHNRMLKKLNATATKTKNNSTSKPNTQTVYELCPALVLCPNCIPEKGGVNKK